MIGDEITLELGDCAIPVRVNKHTLAYAAAQIEDLQGNPTNVYQVTLFNYTQEDYAAQRDPFIVLETLLDAETAAYNADPQGYAYREIEPRSLNTRTVVIVVDKKEDLPATREETFTFKRGAKGYWEAIDVNHVKMHLLASLRTRQRSIQP